MPPSPEYVVESLLDEAPDALLYRARAPDGNAVLLKALKAPHPSPADHASLRRELEVTRLIACDVAIEARELSTLDASPILVYQDDGGTPLSRYVGAPMELDRLLPLSIRLVEALARLHGRQIVHLELNPHHVMVMPDGSVRLTGFGQSSIARKGPGAAASRWPPSMWPYMSPEQTGRLGLLIDHRSDLYSLGVVLHQLLTGKLPFDADDLLEWMHAHCAIASPSPLIQVPTLPVPVGNIVSRLLAKLPEDRYQSAEGLRADLARCLDAWRAQGRIDPFPLGELDAPPPLCLSSGLYGREQEIEQLHRIFSSVVAEGKSQMVLLSGPPGIGKTVLLRHLRDSIPAHRAIFAWGKCDAVVHAVPYGALLQALEDAIVQALAEEAPLEALRRRISEALGVNAPLLASMLPVLTRIVGPQEPPPEAPLHEAERRFLHMFSQLHAALATPRRPVVVFLDDLQWADAGTMKVIEHWASDPDVRNALFIGAYRSTEIAAHHPLQQTIDKLRAPGVKLHEVTLGPLPPEAVTRWMADSLRCLPEEAADLAELVREMAGGNPLFIGQLVNALHREGLIRFSVGARAFRWDLGKIRAKRRADHLADLLAASIAPLSPATQRALALFASHGGSADLHTLSIVLDCPASAVCERLEGAFAARLVAREGGEVRFLHDCIHEAAYERIPPEERPGIHLGIARALLARTPPERLSDRVFDIVHHVNAGHALLETPEERQWAAELNLRAGRKAQARTSFASAITFLSTGIALLGNEAWASHHDVMFDLRIALAQCRFAMGDLGAAEELCLDLLERTREGIEAAPVLYMLTNLRIMQGAVAPAIESALCGLRMLGLSLPLHPTDADVDAACSATLARLAGRSIAALADLPPMTDAHALAACDLIAAMNVPAAYTDWNLVTLGSCAATDLSLEHGNAASSASSYVAFGHALATRYGRHRDAFAFGEMAHRLAQREPDIAHRVRATFAFGALLSYLGLPVRGCIDVLQQGARIAVTTGDHPFAGYFGHHIIDFRLFAGDQLDEVAEEAAQQLSLAERARDWLVEVAMKRQIRLIDALRGGSDPPASEDALEQHPLEMGRFLHHVYTVETQFLMGDLEGARAAAARARALARTAPGFLVAAEYQFHAALAISASHSTIEAMTPASLADLRAHTSALRALSESCPANFASRVALIDAEMARLTGDEQAAEHAYEKAIRTAREDAFVNVEAIASELCALFHRQRGFDTIADAYLAQAHDCYEAWGARAKIAALMRAYPQLSKRPPLGKVGTELLDVLGILKASAAISTALVLPDLHARLLAVALEHAGAERGCLLLRSPQGLVLSASGGADATDFGPTGKLADETRLPLSLCRLALRTHTPILLADAAAPQRYAADPYFQHAKAARRSILCLPIVRQNEAVGLLYLENNMFPGAFSRAQLDVLGVLAARAAISLENARLYTELQQENAERRRAETSLRESQSLLQGIVDNTTAVIYIKNTEGRYLLANRHYEELIGAGRGEIVGKTDDDLFPHEYAAMMRANDARVLAEDRAIEFDEVALHRGVEQQYFSLKFPLRDAGGKPRGVCGISTNVTARRRGEEALRRSYSLLEATLESTADGILVVDGAGNIVQYNQRFADMWRIPEAVLDTRDNYTALAFVKDQLEDPNTFLQSVRDLHQHPESSIFDILRFKDGRVFERYSQPQYLAGRVVGRVFSFRNVTERVRAEQQRDRLLADEQRARAEAEEAVRLRDEFLSIASHELRTPLASLRLAIDRMEKQHPRSMDVERVRWAVSLAGRQITRLEGLVSSLLDVSRIQAGMLELQRAEVDLRAVVQEVVAEHADALARAGSEVCVHAPQPVVGAFDGPRIEQVVANLLTNAIKFGAGKRIEVGLTTNGVTAHLTVKDHGIGVPAELRAHIFERFRRGVSSRHYGGLGLGLYIARTIVEAHGGHVRVESEVGRGSTFSIELPLSAPARHA